ncbi:hypothetical protein PVK06_023118 [Gossypium arboreum]|uniref:Uncharacterized protein n=1 Tax=Gossypium arboreum TaxID=29729 RepID=A0ABR0PAI8_GOSAR|nr:hypothetical protein PVK06_023118 [Gossypium arboreum]
MISLANNGVYESSRSERHDQLRDTKVSHIAELIDSGELEICKGKNQVGTLQRLGDTRWGSHSASLNCLMRMFDFVYVVLQYIIKSDNLTQRSEVDGIYDGMTSVEFVFILHFIIEMFGIFDDLYQALQYKLQDILNAMQLVSSTKMLLQKFKEHGWDPLFKKMKLFCKDHEIEVHNLSVMYKAGRG